MFDIFFITLLKEHFMYGLRHWLIETFRLEDENAYDYEDKICLLRFFAYCPRPSLPSVATDDWKPVKTD